MRNLIRIFFTLHLTLGHVLAQDKIGEVRLKIGTSDVDRSGEMSRLAAGDDLFRGDILSTGNLGYLGIELNDGTRFVLGKGAQAVLTDFDDADSKNPRFKVVVLAGAFRYKSTAVGTPLPGRLHTTLSTSCMNAGIRGSELEGFVDPAGTTTLVHQSGYIVVTDVDGNDRRVLDTPGQVAVCSPSRLVSSF